MLIETRADLQGMNIMALPALDAYHLEAGCYEAVEQEVNISGIKMPFITVANGRLGAIWGVSKDLFLRAVLDGSAIIKEK